MRAGITVGDAMTVRPVSAPPDMSIHNVAVLMDMHSVGSVLVIKGKELLGLVTERDFATRVCLEGYDPVHTPVEQVMTRDLLTVGPGMDLFDALLLMKDADVKHLPVTDEDSLLGFITVKDILKLQPHLFENFVDMIDLREESRKISKAREKNQAVLFEED